MTLPAAFEERMRRLLGEEEYGAFRNAMEQERSRGLRLNPLKLPDEEKENTSHAEYLRKLLGQGEEEAEPERFEEIPWARPYGFFYPEELRPGKSPLHEAGLYYLQEPSAMSVAAFAGAKPGEKILDLCAAPGGKSTQLAGVMLGQGVLVSNEIHPARARILSQNLERLGVPNVLVTNESPEKLAERFASWFDRVIVDAPCSGEGMFRKEEQALSGWSPENVALCAKRQRSILEQAAVMVKAGGQLIYSTCTFAPAEDEETIGCFLAEHPEFSLVDLPAFAEKRAGSCGFDTGHSEWCHAGALREDTDLRRTLRLWPHRLRGEGHFMALLQKEGSLLSESVPRGENLDGRSAADGACTAARKKNPKGNRKAGGPGTMQRQQIVPELEATAVKRGVLQRMADAMGAGIICYGEDVYLMPYREQIQTEGLRILRPGLQIGTIKKERLEPAHALAMALRPSEAQRTVELPPEGAEAAAFVRGESLPCDPSWRGWTLVTTAGISLGWGKAAGGMLKNHYPKGLRRQL